MGKRDCWLNLGGAVAAPKGSCVAGLGGENAAEAKSRCKSLESRVLSCDTINQGQRQKDLFTD